MWAQASQFSAQLRADILGLVAARSVNGAIHVRTLVPFLWHVDIACCGGGQGSMEVLAVHEGTATAH